MLIPLKVVSLEKDRLRGIAGFAPAVCLFLIETNCTAIVPQSITYISMPGMYLVLRTCCMSKFIRFLPYPNFFAGTDAHTNFYI